MNLSDVLVLLGASAGAAGSIAAAFLDEDLLAPGLRLGGSHGALTAGAPKTLDDPADILTEARAGRAPLGGGLQGAHPDDALLRALQRAGPHPAGGAAHGQGRQGRPGHLDQQRQKALLYVLDRFIDCTADQPRRTSRSCPPRASSPSASRWPAGSQRSRRAPALASLARRPPWWRTRPATEARRAHRPPLREAHAHLQPELPAVRASRCPASRPLPPNTEPIKP